MAGMDQIRSGHDAIASLTVHSDARIRPRISSTRCAVGEVTLAGDFAEFGVYRGKTAKVILELMTGERKLHLFDSFEGLPEDWTRNKKAGAFKISAEEIPQFDPQRVVMHKGWFKDTVPPWGQETSAPLSFLHMDADLYSSTVDVLFNINHLIVPGTIILFDEYIMGPTDDEHRALVAWAAKFDREFDYLWRSAGPQVCIRITR